MSAADPPPYPGDSGSQPDGDLPSYGSVPPPPPPPGGGTPGGGPPPPPPVSGPAQNQKALASMILGIVSVPGGFCCCGIIGFGMGIAAIICGILGRKEIRSSAGQQSGDGMALAGIITGSVGIVVAFFGALFGLAAGLSGFDPSSFAP